MERHKRNRAEVSLMPLFLPYAPDLLALERSAQPVGNRLIVPGRVVVKGVVTAARQKGAFGPMNGRRNLPRLGRGNSQIARPGDDQCGCADLRQLREDV